MVLRKITVDNSVRYIKKSESKADKIKKISGGGESNTRKNNSSSRKQEKNIS